MLDRVWAVRPGDSSERDTHVSNQRTDVRGDATGRRGEHRHRAGVHGPIVEDALVHEWPIFTQYGLGEDRIPPKYRELLEVAVAATLERPYCETFHRGAAQLHGATVEELAEPGLLAGLTARWSAMLHSQHYYYDTFVDEFEQISAQLQAGQVGTVAD